MNDRVLIITILSLLGIGMVAVLFIVVPWFMDRGFPNWKQMLLDDGIIIAVIALFVYGFYMNTRMH